MEAWGDQRFRVSGPQEMVETDGLIMPDLGGEGSEARRGWQTGGEGTAGCLGPGLGMERKEGPVHPTSASDGFSCTFLLCKSVLPLCKELRPERQARRCPERKQRLPLSCSRCARAPARHSVPRQLGLLAALGWQGAAPSAGRRSARPGRPSRAPGSDAAAPPAAGSGTAGGRPARVEGGSGLLAAPPR